VADDRPLAAEERLRRRPEDGAGTAPDSGDAPAGLSGLPRGLTAAQAAARLAAGQGNRSPAGPSRTVGEILRANVLTRFNALLGGLLVVILIVGPLQDALFGLLLVANSGIGIFQELRAKRTLERLTLLHAPTAAVVRDGELRVLPVDGLVLGDVVALAAGDQVVVDGVVLCSEELEVDEALLTGESEPVVKPAGAELRSGSFAAAGHGFYRATRVGAEAYAAALAAQARRFSLVRSELRDVTNRVLRIITWVLVPTAVLLVVTQLPTAGTGWPDAVRGSVAGVAGMVPEGFVLLTSMAFALGVVRLARRRVLVQELPAIEALARVDVVCLDKTGTLTEPAMAVAAVEPFAADAQVEAALGALAAADPRPNATLAALRDHFPDPGWRREAAVAFSSARKWSAARFRESGWWVLGAPRMVLPGSSHPVLERADRLAAQGLRVLLLARGASGPSRAAAAQPPPEPQPVALVALRERIRPTARATLEYFAQQGVAVKVVSGDAPATVGAIAADLGLPGAERPRDASALPERTGELAHVLEQTSVLGRVTPQQKERIVRALQRRGHVVAMTGDGVNDVLALKQADIGVAMGAGASAARAVARLVLLDSTFDALPGVVTEGRRVIGNVERVAGLFLTKTAYVMLLAVAVALTGLPFPFFPRHLTLISTLTIGLPGFFLALSPRAPRVRPGILGRVVRFAAPAGVVIAAAAYTAYALARATGGGEAARERTAATVVVTLVGLWVLVRIARPLTAARTALLAAMAALAAGAFLLPAARRFLALAALPWQGWAAAGLLAVAAVGLWHVLRWALDRWRPVAESVPEVSTRRRR
jgi:cation-transporting ATPase E